MRSPMLRQVKLQNFKSHSTTTIPFAPGTTLILGPNGAGKSSLLEAITYGLYGEVPDTLAAVVKHGETGARVTVDFSPARDPARYYRVTREIQTRGTSTSTKHAFYEYPAPVPPAPPTAGPPGTSGTPAPPAVDDAKFETLATSKRKCDALVEAALAVPGDVFKNAVYIRQGEIQALTQEIPSKRKPVFDKLLGFEKYERAWKGLRPLLNHFDQALTGINARVSTLQADVDALPEVRAKLEALETERETLARQHAPLEQTVAKLKATVAALQADNADLKSKRQERALLEGTRQDLTAAVARHHEKLEAIAENVALDVPASDLFADPAPLNRALAGAVTDTRGELETARARKETVAADLEDAREQARQLQTLRDKREDLQADLNDTLQQIREVVAFDTLADLRARIQAIKQAREQIPGLQAKLEKLQAAREELQAQRLTRESKGDFLAETARALQETGECPTCHTQLEPERVETLARELTEQSETVDGAAETVAAKLAQVSETRAALQDQLETIQADERKLEKLEYWIKALGKKKAKLAAVEEEVSDAEAEGAPEVEPIRARLVEAERAVEALAGTVGDLERDAVLLETLAEDQARDGAKLETTRARLDTLAAEIVAAEERVDEEALADQTQALEDKTRELHQLEERRELLAARLIPEVEARVEEVEAKQAQLEEARAELVGVYKKKRLVEFVRDLVRELEPRVRQTILGKLNQLASQLFEEIFGTSDFDKLELDAKDYELTYYRGGARENSTRASGGETISMSLALRLAISRLTSQGHLPMLFLDEPTVYLDETRKHHLIEAIARIQSVPQLFVITHDVQFENTADHVVLVTKTPQGSRARVLSGLETTGGASDAAAGSEPDPTKTSTGA